MTDLTKIFDDFKNSDVELTNEFWEEQNIKLRLMQEVFAEKSRLMNYNKIIFNV
tara:strand:- start:1813 stop:1974 length:162 start_codon:yes stop_codon:yes gene_type:complete